MDRFLPPFGELCITHWVTHTRMKSSIEFWCSITSINSVQFLLFLLIQKIQLRFWKHVQEISLLFPIWCSLLWEDKIQSRPWKEFPYYSVFFDSPPTIPIISFNSPELISWFILSGDTCNGGCQWRYTRVLPSLWYSCHLEWWLCKAF